MLKRVAFLMAITVTFITVLSTVEAQDEKPNLGLLMWSAFVCSNYAEMFGDIQEQKRLFDIGYDAGTKFLVGIKNKTIPDAEASRAPWVVLMGLGGPTNDFVIGRIFEAAAEDAHDKVVKTDKNGLPILDPSDWISDKLKVQKADNKYRSSNCALIR